MIYAPSVAFFQLFWGPQNCWGKYTVSLGSESGHEQRSHLIWHWDIPAHLTMYQDSVCGLGNMTVAWVDVHQRLKPGHGLLVSLYSYASESRNLWWMFFPVYATGNLFIVIIWDSGCIHPSALTAHVETLSQHSSEEPASEYGKVPLSNHWICGHISLSELKIKPSRPKSWHLILFIRIWLFTIFEKIPVAFYFLDCFYKGLMRKPSKQFFLTP